MITQRIFVGRWLTHTFFWLFSIYFIGSYFSVSNTVDKIDFFYSFLFHIPLAVLVYVNLSLLLPAFLERERYIRYSAWALALLAATYFIHELAFEGLLPLLPVEFYIVSFTDGSVLFGIFIIYMALTTLLHLARSWYRLQQLVKAQLSTELGSLRAQLNPHFLFNSLNSIYSMALAKSTQTAETVLQLADLLRYTLYELKEERVPLSKEIDMIRTYLALQDLRTDHAAEVKFEITGELKEKTIAPLLLFPLVENAYKHGVTERAEEAKIEMRLTIEDTISFFIKNRKGETKRGDQPRTGGIGLQNIKRRLELLYPHRHKLNIDDSDKEFAVNLILK